MPDFSIQKAALACQLIQPLFYGILVVTYGFCLQSLLRTGKGTWRKWSDVSRPMLAVSSAMFAISTFDLLLVFAINLKALEATEAAGSAGSSEVLAASSSWMNVVNVSISLFGIPLA